jgi:hypothetical protein
LKTKAQTQRQRDREHRREEKRRDMEMGVGSQPFLPMDVAGRTKSSGCQIWIRKKKTFTTDEFSFACWGCD